MTTKKVEGTESEAWEKSKFAIVVSSPSPNTNTTHNKYYQNDISTLTAMQISTHTSTPKISTTPNPEPKPTSIP